MVVIIKNILISLVCSFLFMHTVVAHEHFANYSSRHNIEHQKATTFISHLALGFHHGSEKDLNESTTTSDLDINIENIQGSFLLNNITSEISLIIVCVDLFDFESIQKTYKSKFYKSNTLRAPPR